MAEHATQITDEMVERAVASLRESAAWSVTNPTRWDGWDYRVRIALEAALTPRAESLVTGRERTPASPGSSDPHAKQPAPNREPGEGGGTTRA